MLLFAYSVFLVLALPQAVLARFKFSFSDVEQCGPVNISFSGDDLATNAIPVTLTVLPFNSSPISIPIPNAMTNSSGVYVTFLPLAAGTTFIASLDDASADNTGRVTDVSKVLPSSTGNTTCLPSVGNTPKRFEFDNTLSQCALFNVTYDITTTPRPPSVRAFTPFGGSKPVNLTSQPSQGISSYTMTARHGSQVVLMFDDGQGHRETSELITVDGDSTSDSSCLQFNFTIPQTNMAKSASHIGLSRPVIIGISAGAGSLVLLISLLMALYAIRERRRRRRGILLGDEGGANYGDSANYKDDPKRPEKSFADGFSEGFVRNPAYTARGFSYTGARDSMSSWEQVIPDDQRRPMSSNVRIDGPRLESRPTSYNNDNRSINQPSLSTIDIERILDMATLYQERNSTDGRSRSSKVPSVAVTRPVDPTPRMSSLNVLSTDYLAVPPATPRPIPTRAGHSHDPSDVPMSMSMLFPNVPSTGPLRINTTLRSSAYESEQARLSYLSSTSSSAILSPRSTGLPSSPRSRPVLSRYSKDRIVNRGGMDNGGIGGVPQRPLRNTSETWGDLYGNAL